MTKPSLLGLPGPNVDPRQSDNSHKKQHCGLGKPMECQVQLYTPVILVLDGKMESGNRVPGGSWAS